MSRSETKNAQGQTNEQQNNQQQRSNQQQTGHQAGSMQSGSTQTRGQGGGRGLARRSSHTPILFSLDPREVLTTSPFELMARFTEEMDRMFEEFGLSTQGTSRGQGGGLQAASWVPAIDILERDGNLVVRAELPGVDDADVSVSVTDDGLVIEGERKEEHEENREGFYRTERSYGHFYRLIPLPDDVDPDQVRADFNNGVLEITVPIPQSQERRREIPVNAQGGEQSQAATTRQK